jgi:hypothetical protein
MTHLCGSFNTNIKMMTNPETWAPLPGIPKTDYGILKDITAPIKKKWREWIGKNNLINLPEKKEGLTILEQRFNHFL